MGTIGKDMTEEAKVLEWKSFGHEEARVKKYFTKKRIIITVYQKEIQYRLLSHSFDGELYIPKSPSGQFIR